MGSNLRVQVDSLTDRIYRICIGEPEGFIAFNHFLIVDECPALVYLGHQQSFETLKRSVAAILDPATIRYLAFSHYEADECGALNQWLAAAPQAEVLVGKICASSLKDFAPRPVTVLKDEQVVSLGRDELVLFETPHFPHNWDACLFYLKGEQVLFGSDLGTQLGFQPLLSEGDLPKTVMALQEKMEFMPWGTHMADGIRRLQKLEIKTLATMHGSALSRTQAQQFLNLLSEANQRHCRDLFKV